MRSRDVNISQLHQEELRKKHEAGSVSNEFVQEHMSMVESISSTILGMGKVPPCIEFDDLISWGIEGLIKAKKNFKGDKGAQFKTYAYYRIRGEILDKIRSEWQHRNPGDYDEYRKRVQGRIADMAIDQLENTDVDSSIQSTVHSVIESSGMVFMISAEDYDLESEKKGTKNPEVEQVDESPGVLWEEIKSLTSEEQEILDMFYVRGLKQVEIADRLNYSRSKVCRLHMQVLSKLRNRLNKRYNE